MRPRYSLRTLLILMLLVGPLCIWGWPAFETWRDERAGVAREVHEIKRIQQSIAILDPQSQVTGVQGGAALSGKETINELVRIRWQLEGELIVAQEVAQARKIL